VVEFVRGAVGAGRRTLTEERTDTEATWSLATEADADALSKAFGKADAPKPPLSTFVPDGGKRGVRDLAVIFSIVLAVVSLPAWLFGDDDFFGSAIIAAIALWAPLRVLRDEDD
jgi:hypothetical protein